MVGKHIKHGWKDVKVFVVAAHFADMIIRNHHIKFFHRALQFLIGVRDLDRRMWKTTQWPSP